jgi:hypothetical protein
MELLQQNKNILKFMLIEFSSLLTLLEAIINETRKREIE